MYKYTMSSGRERKKRTVVPFSKKEEYVMIIRRLCPMNLRVCYRHLSDWLMMPSPGESLSAVERSSAISKASPSRDYFC